MPHQILAAVNHHGKRMPMCAYPDQMHDFQPLTTVTTQADKFQLTVLALACRFCGAELQSYEAPEDAGPPPSPSNRPKDDNVIRYWGDAVPPEEY